MASVKSEKRSNRKTKSQRKSLEGMPSTDDVSQTPLPNSDCEDEVTRPNGVHMNGEVEEEVTKPALLVGYEESIRPCIDLIDKLRALGVDQDVNLPTIAVVGDQSAGKSSVLEAISGVQLPRGTGIVTRCPLELRMKNKPKGTAWRSVISYTPPGTESVKIEIRQPTAVGDHIRKAQDTLAGSGNGVCKHLITLEVESSGIPDLTLIDLPGIARVAMDDQPYDLPQQIRQLIESYIKRDETIILAVIPANVDIATTEALQLARQYDKDGNRTLGVITKPDLVDKGSEPELLAVITNAKLPLQKGYVCVRCRGQSDLNKGLLLEQAIAVEEEYFATTEHFRDLQDSGLLGTKCLARKLTDQLVEHITSSLPSLRKNVREKLAAVHERLQKMGKGVPTDINQRKFRFAEVMNGFSEEVLRLTESRLVNAGKEMRIHNRFRKAFVAFLKTLDQFSPELLGTKRDEMLARLEKDIDEYRGSELPRFLNYDMFRSKVNEYVGDYHTPMDRTLKVVSGITKEIYDNLATSYFNQYPELQRAVKTTIVNYIREAEEASSRRLEEYLEMEKLVYTQDSFFSGKLDKIIAKRVEDEEQREKQRQNGRVLMNAQQWLNKLDDVTAPNTRVQAETMYDFILTYLIIAKRRMADIVPMVLYHELLNKLATNVRTGVIAMVGEHNVLEKFRETEVMAVDRRTTENRYDRLQNALAELDCYAY